MDTFFALLRQCDWQSMTAEFEEAYILIYDKKVPLPRDLVPTKTAQLSKPCF